METLTPSETETSVDGSQEAEPSPSWILRFATFALLGGFVLTALAAIVPVKLSPPLNNYLDVRKDQLANVPKRLSILDFNASIHNVSKQANLEVCESADWLTVCHRLSLALLGSNLALQDIRELEKLPLADRVNVFLESCLADPRWSNYWAERFARAFIGNDQGPFITFRRRLFVTWLAESLSKDLPYDLIVQRMLTAEGLWTDHPEVNFYTATFDEEKKEGQPPRADAVRITGRVARVFLGQRIDCLQCHDDFLGNTDFVTAEGERGGQQIDFHRLAAYFDGVSLRNPLLGVADDARIYETTLLGQSSPSVIEPAVPFETKLMQHVGQSAKDRRQQLATWLTDPSNEHFSTATVNRVWNLMTGTPLVSPVDHIDCDAAMYPSLKKLADEFVTGQFDLKSLIRYIATSEAFHRNSTSETFKISLQHEQFWAAFPVVRLRPEQIVTSITQSTRLTRLSDQANILDQLGRFDANKKFLKRFGDANEAELDISPPTLSQRLLMLNGQAVTKATEQDVLASAVAKIATFTSERSESIDQVYLLVLNRYPSSNEKQQLLSDFFPEQSNALQSCCDLAAALFNSAEFQWNH